MGNLKYQNLNIILLKLNMNLGDFFFQLKKIENISLGYFNAVASLFFFSFFFADHKGICMLKI